MNSLPIRILAAIITFTIGVGIASFWWMRPADPRIDPVSTEVPAERVEIVFVLDTTGSMGGLIDGARQRIWGIVNDVMQESHSSVKIGLVAYRDRGDEYVTQVLPLTEDLDKVYTTLMDYRAAGGGDMPEQVRLGLADGVYKAGWSGAAPDIAQIIFLVGDAPPKDDPNDTSDTFAIAAKAAGNGLIVNTIQCGSLTETTRAWKAIANSGHGQYFAIADNGGVQTISTPYDEQLGKLSSELGSTFTAYGFGALPDAEQHRVEVTKEIASVESRVTYSAPDGAKAERALNKAVNKVAYLGDLLQNIENGTLKLENVPTADLPEELQSLSPAERQQEIERRLAKRREIRALILKLSKDRDRFVDAERTKGGAADGFDVVVSKALKEQIVRKKLK
jgi:Mg-chelatase subunit ChlD